MNSTGLGRGLAFLQAWKLIAVSEIGRPLQERIATNKKLHIIHP